MPLTLTIRNVTSLDNGSPASLVLDRRGAKIGRAATCDWALPDPTRFISSNHCEVRCLGEQYELIDVSTNGTFLKGQDARLAAPHLIGQGDIFIIGRFEIVAALDEGSAAAAAARNASPQTPEWQGWAASAPQSAAAPHIAASSWDAPPAASAISGGGPMSQAWAAPPVASGVEASGGGWGAPAAPPASPSATDGWGAPPQAFVPPTPVATPSAWDSAPAPVTPASSWSSPAAAAATPAADDIWGQFAQSNVVDWARGGFGSPPASPVPVSTPAPAFAPAPAPVFAAQPPPPAAVQAAPPPQPQAAPPPPSTDISALFAAAGIDPAQLNPDTGSVLAAAGDLLRRLVAGLYVLVEARARAKSQMGAQGTSFEINGNNPLKFARTPEQALVQLLNPPERGFVSADAAVEDAFKDLQAHQMATLKAMQGALRATLDRFSPTAIRARADKQGFLAKILPGSRDAALWAAYEREFGGVVHGSDEAFMDMFAKEFRRAYDDIARGR
ncbi:MAG: type VI secretion system-associated FHA domain protein TagH [Novosphingobium sp.]